MNRASRDLSPTGDSTPPSGIQWRWNHGWSCVDLGDAIELSGGLDETYRISAAEADRAWVISLESSGAFERASAPNDAIFDQLSVIGAAVPTAGAAEASLVVALEWFGSPRPALHDALVRALDVSEQPAAARSVTFVGNPDLTVLVRTDAPWADLVRLPHPPGPTLFVDHAFHHTLAVGPFAVVGDTACIHCLAVRVNANWAQPTLPKAPEVARRSALPATLLAIEVAAIAAGLPQTINATVSWNLATGERRREALLPSPFCPTCMAGHP